MNMFSGAEQINVFLAFGAGVLIFFNPCVLPLVPSYLMMITGLSADDMKSGDRRLLLKRTLGKLLLFSGGFTLVFVTMGGTATVLGSFLTRNSVMLERVGGAFVVLMGLFLLGSGKIPFLSREARFRVRGGRTGAFPFLFGVSFSLGWSPCMGPVLAALLLYASSGTTVLKGMALLGVFSGALMIMFLIAGTAFVYFLALFRAFEKAIPVLKKISALFLIGVGGLMLF